MQQMTKLTEDGCFEEKNSPCIHTYIFIAPAYIHVHNHYFQTSLKPFGQSKPNFLLNLLVKRGQKYKNGLGHMTKTAAMLIYSKTFKKLLRSQRFDDLET